MVRIIIDVKSEVKNGVEHELVDKAVKATREAIAGELMEIISNTWLTFSEERTRIEKLANKLKED